MPRGESILARVLYALAIYSLLATAGSAQSNDDWSKKELAWRQQRTTLLLGDPPVGWLSVAGLRWLSDGEELTVGSASDNEVRLDHCAPHLGVFHLKSGRVTISSPRNGFPKSMRVDGKQATEQILHPVFASNHPSTIQDGPTTIYVMWASGRLGLSIWDTQSETRLNFHGLKWYLPDATYIVHARWIPYDRPKLERHTSVLGLVSKIAVPGVAEFSLNGRIFRLEPLDVDDDTLQFPIGDRTNGRTTYGGGRFLNAPYPDHGLNKPGEILLDLNKLYNPPCAFTHFVNCTLAPVGNRLPIALKVGEQKY